MDDQVVDAMKRWPDVPAAFGWLRLDRRGRWYLIDRDQPGFTESTHGTGSLITSDQIVEFISRNYTCDEAGRWFWQNGPQKAYVNIDAAPLILRVVEQTSVARAKPAQPDQVTTQGLVTHTGYLVDTISGAWVGPDDALYLQTNLGPACVHDLDLSALTLSETSVEIMGRQFALQAMTASPAETLGFEAMPIAAN